MHRLLKDRNLYSVARQPKQRTSLYLKNFAVLIVTCLEITIGCTCDLNPVPLQKIRVQMFLLVTTELYSFLVSIPQEKSDEVPWTICQNFCSFCLLGPEKLANFKEFGLSQRREAGAEINTSLKQFCIFIRSALNLFP